jgi:hypothetical protein
MNSRLPCTDTSPCPPGQTDRRQQLRLARPLDVVGVEAVEVAHEEMVAAERESEFAKLSMFANRGSGGASGSSGGRFGSRSGGVGAPPALRIEEAFRLEGRARSASCSRRFAGIASARLQPDARIGAERPRRSCARPGDQQGEHAAAKPTP